VARHSAPVAAKMPMTGVPCTRLAPNARIPADLAQAHPSRPDCGDPGRPHRLAALFRIPAVPAARLPSDPPDDRDRVQPRSALGLSRPTLCPARTGQSAAGRHLRGVSAAAGSLRAPPELRPQGTKTEHLHRLSYKAWRVGRIHSGRPHLSSRLSAIAMSSFLLIRSRGGRAGARIRPSQRFQYDHRDRPLSAPMRGNRGFPLITLPLKIAGVFAGSGQRVFTG
jgi:hypothetical protein